MSSLSQPEETGALVRTGSRFISEDDLRTRQDKSEANRQSLAIQHAILSDCATLIHSNGKSDFNVQNHIRVSISDKRLGFLFIAYRVGFIA